jgi:hypothetical protein
VWGTVDRRCNVPVNSAQIKEQVTGCRLQVTGFRDSGFRIQGSGFSTGGNGALAKMRTGEYTKHFVPKASVVAGVDDFLRVFASSHLRESQKLLRRAY